MIVFRDGNRLVQVTYEESDERYPLSGDHAVRGAYAAAPPPAAAWSGTMRPRAGAGEALTYILTVSRP